MPSPTKAKVAKKGAFKATPVAAASAAPNGKTDAAPSKKGGSNFLLAALPGLLLAAGYAGYTQSGWFDASSGGLSQSQSQSLHDSQQQRRAVVEPEPGSWTDGFYAPSLAPGRPPSTHALVYPNGGGSVAEFGVSNTPDLVEFKSESDFRSHGRLYDDLGRIVPTLSHFPNGTALYRGPERPGTHFQWPPVAVGHKRTVPGLLGGDGLPVELETLTDPTSTSDPRVFYVHNFLSAAEADEFVRFSTAEENPYKMAPSTGGTHKAWNQGGADATLKTRTSMNAFDITSDASRTVKLRAYKLLRMGVYDERLADGIQILRYELGQAYTAHHDYFPSKQSDDFNWDPAHGGSNRFATIFLYLSDVEFGGQTVFPKSERLTSETSADLVRRLGEAPPGEVLTSLRAEAGLEPKSWEDDLIKKCYTKFAVPPRRGDAILFYSQRPDGTLDEASLHGACPVLKGTKWGANLWVWNACRYSMCKEDPLNPTDELPKELKAPFAD